MLLSLTALGAMSFPAYVHTINFIDMCRNPTPKLPATYSYKCQNKIEACVVNPSCSDVDIYSAVLCLEIDHSFISPHKYSFALNLCFDASLASVAVEYS